MQLIVNRNALVEVLNVASSIVSSRTTKEILKCVRLSTTGEGLAVAATDLEVALQVTIAQADVKKKGELLVPADKLMQIARESLDDTLTIEADGENCHVRGLDSHFEVYGQNPREFPPVPELEGTPDIEIQADVLAGLIEKTIFAVAKENTRYAINGILWEKQAKRLCLVATDGRRLAKALGSATQTAGEENSVIVPAKTMQVLQRILDRAEGTAAIRLASNQVVIQAGGYTLSSALVEGHFPNYEEVIPKDSDKKLDVKTDELLSAVRRAALLTNEQSKGVRLSFEKERLVLSSRAPEQGEATVSLRVDYTQDPVEMGFNPNFITDALRAAGASQVTLEFKAPNRPGIIRVGQEFMYVVMPVNLS